MVDPIFVTDVADCCVLAAANPNAAGEAYNVAPTDEVGLREFLSLICRGLKLSPPVWTLPYPLAYAATTCCELWGRMTNSRHTPALTSAALASFTVDQHFDPSKAIRDLGWRPVVSLADGVARTANWLSSRHSI